MVSLILLNEIDNPMIFDYSNRFLEMAKEAAESILHHKNIPVDERTINLCKKKSDISLY